MRTLTIVSLCLLVRWAGAAEPELKGTASELAQFLAGVPKVVTVTGEAELKVPADKAIVSLNVTTESKALQEALRANQELRGKLLGFLKKQGIAPEHVQTSRFSSTPKFGILREKAKSYRVDNLVKVTVHDEKELQSAASAVDNWSEVQYAGAEFEHETKEALKNKVVALACDNANERRKAYDERLGIKLVPSRFSGGIVSQKRPMNVGNHLPDSIYVQKSALTSAGLPQAEVEAVAESTSAFGELVYAVQVIVEYTVQSK